MDKAKKLDKNTENLIHGVEDLRAAVNDMMKWIPRKCRILVLQTFDTGMLRTLDPVTVNDRMKNANAVIDAALQELVGDDQPITPKARALKAKAARPSVKSG